MDSQRPSFIIGYTDSCESWHLVEPLLNLNFPLKITSDLFPNLKYYRPKFISFDYLTHSPNDVSVVDQPVIYFLLISLPTLKTYKSNIRSLIQSWIERLSFIEDGRIVIIYSQSRIDSVASKVIEKISHDISTIYHNKCHLYIVESNALKLTNKFTDLIIACLVERRKKLVNSYNDIWDLMNNIDDSSLSFKQVFTASEDLATFYIQTCEYVEALKIYYRLSHKGISEYGKKIIGLFVTSSLPSDFNQPTIIFSDHLYDYVNELTNGLGSYLYFSQYCLGMILLLHRMIGCNQTIEYLKDCLDFITYSRRLISKDNVDNSHKWFINTILEIADSCSTLISEKSLSNEEDIKQDRKLKEYRILGMLYSHAYFISKLDSDKITSKLLDNAINNFNLGGYTRLSKALSLIDNFNGTESDKWINVWDLLYPPFIQLENLGEIVNIPLPTQVYNTFNNTEIPLQFFCPLIRDESISLAIEIKFILVTNNEILIKSNTLISVGKSTKFKLKEPVILPEGVWLLCSVTHNNKILYPRDIALYCDNKSTYSTKCIIKVTNPLSLKMYSDRVIDNVHSPSWFCGYNNYIEFTSIIDPFEIIFPIPLILIDISNSTPIMDNESNIYKFDAGKYNFMVYCHITEVMVGTVVMKSCKSSTKIESKISIFPLFEINVHYISELFSQLEITAFKPINIQLQVDTIKSEESDGNDSENTLKIKKYPPLIPFVPFYLIVDITSRQCNQTLLITWENKTFNINVMDLLAKNSMNPNELGIDISANGVICTGEPFAVNINGSKNEDIACEFEDNDNFVLCGWNRKVFLGEESQFLQLQVHFIPIGIHGHNVFPSLKVTTYPNNELLGTLNKDVYVSPSKVATFEITEL